MIYKDDLSSIEINIEYFREDLTKKNQIYFLKENVLYNIKMKCLLTFSLHIIGNTSQSK